MIKPASRQPSMEDLHQDEERFWKDFAIVLSHRSTDKQGAFCIGLVAAISMLGHGYPTRDVMRLAAEQNPRLFHRRVLAGHKAATQPPEAL